MELASLVAEACCSGEAFPVRLERPSTGYRPLTERVAGDLITLSCSDAAVVRLG